MGSFYTNVTLRTENRSHVRQDLASHGATAFLSRPENGALVVFERESEAQDLQVLRTLAKDLSARLGCSALAVANHDDSVLLYALFVSGTLADEYNSAPSYFDDAPVETARGGDGIRLASAFGVPERALQVSAVLGLPGADSDDDDVVFETDRHEQLLEALGLPRCAVGTGYEYLSSGEYPSGYTADHFERVGVQQ